MLGFIIFLLICYIIYRFATAKHRMAQKIYNYILHLHASGQSHGVLNDILYDNAFKYAMAHGAKPDQEDIYKGQVQMEMKINGINYYIFFSKMPNGSTYIGITDADKSREEFRKRIYGDSAPHSTQNCNKQVAKEDSELKVLLNEFYRLTRDKETVQLMTSAASGIPISALDLGKVRRPDEIVKRIAIIKNISVKDLFEKNIINDLLNEYVPEYSNHRSNTISSVDLEDILEGFLAHLHETADYSGIFEGYLYNSVLIGNLNKDKVKSFLIKEVLPPIDLKGDKETRILDKYVTQIYRELKEISDGVQDVVNSHDELMRLSSQQQVHKKNSNTSFDDSVPF